MKKIIFLLCFFFLFYGLRADEGMWIPLLLEKYNIEDMQKCGFKLTAEDIYSINHASLKDAVVIFGGGCTGEVVSGEGLVFTNHHCGFRYIQSHSSVEKDYLTHGFWAMSKEEELPNPSLSVTFLKKIEDVTVQVLKGTENELTEYGRQDLIAENINNITAPFNKNPFNKAVVKPFYYGNEYYMFVYEIYTDVRLVGAPPGSVGNFGEDNDNWMWPRHTGDFSVFRIYADENNQPADYSPDNVPFKPKKYLPVSLKGYEEGDFTMVMGYPGSTTRFYTHEAVRLIVEKSLPNKIELRDTRLAIMNKHMKESDKVRIQYASKYRSVSNAWKKWKGIILGLDKANALEEKAQIEKKFADWVNEDPARKPEYGNTINELELLYEELSDYMLVYEYGSEAFLATEIMNLIMDINTFLKQNMNLPDSSKIMKKEVFMGKLDRFFKDYYQPIDQEIYAAMLEAYARDIDESFHPEILSEVIGKYNGNCSEFAQNQFKKSLFPDKDKLYKLFDSYPEKEAQIKKKIMKDPLFQTYTGFMLIYGDEVSARYEFIQNEVQSAYRTYVKGLREMNKDEYLYPDANFTMRVAYGEIEGYQPKDAVIYSFETTLEGVMEKYYSGMEDYQIPEKLRELYVNQDYGRYADKSGAMNVCFIASNHTSGGNSGSPVLNSEGELIGLNFDRNWEGTMSDIFYDKSQCRNITVDIRYVLFIIDKYAGAGYLLDEMNLVYN